MTKANLNPKLRVKFLREKSLDSTPVKPGNMLVTTDTGKFYWDVLSTKGETKRIYPNLDTINQSKALETGAVSSDKDVYADIQKYKHSTFDKSKFTATSKVTLTDDGVASGFANGEHLHTNTKFNFGTSDWEITISWNAVDSVHTQDLLSFTYNNLSIRQNLAEKSYPLDFRCCTDSSTAADGSQWVPDVILRDLSPQHSGYVKYKWGYKKESGYYLKKSTDGTTFITVDTDNNTNPVVFVVSGNVGGSHWFNIGSYWNPTYDYKFLGSIDLKDFMVTVDGVEVFNGNKTGMDAIKEDNYTTVTTLYAYKDTQTETISYYAWSSGYYTTTLTENANSYIPVYKKSTDSSGNVTFTNVGSGRIIPAGTSITNDGYSISNSSTMNISDNTITFSEVTLANIITSENKIYFGKRESDNDTTATTNPIIYADSSDNPTALYNADGSNYTGSKFTVADEVVKYGDNICTYTPSSNGTIDIVIKVSDDGVASGFSDWNYISAPNLGVSSNVTLMGKFKTGDILTPTQCICRLASGLLFYIKGGKIKADFPEDVLDRYPNLTETTEKNTEYTWKIKMTPTEIKCYVNGELTNTIAVTDYSVNLTTVHIGNDRYHLNRPFLGSIDLNSFKIYVDGKLVYQPMLKIPYTLSKTGSKIVNSTYRDRVTDVYEQYGVSPYYTIDEENKDFTLPQGEVYGMVGSRILYDSYKNGAEFYNLYMDGYLEQGGSCTSGTSVTLLKEFKDNNYNLSIPYSAKTASNFTPSQTGDWIARGYTYLG